MEMDRYPGREIELFLKHKSKLIPISLRIQLEQIPVQ